MLTPQVLFPRKNVFFLFPESDIELNFKVSIQSIIFKSATMKGFVIFIFLLSPLFTALNAQTTSTDTAKFVLASKLALDLDGAKHAYHPNNEGIDHNLNGGINQTE